MHSTPSISLIQMSQHQLALKLANAKIDANFVMFRKVTAYQGWIQGVVNHFGW